MRSEKEIQNKIKEIKSRYDEQDDLCQSKLDCALHYLKWVLDEKGEA